MWGCFYLTLIYYNCQNHRHFHHFKLFISLPVTFMVSFSVFPVGKVLSQAGSVCWEGLCVSTAVSYVHHSWSSALVRQRGTGWSLFRYILNGTSQESYAKLIYFYNKTRAGRLELKWPGDISWAWFFMKCFFILVVCVRLAVPYIITLIPNG